MCYKTITGCRIALVKEKYKEIIKSAIIYRSNHSEVGARNNNGGINAPVLPLKQEINV
jgi:hypothetical protein